MKTIRLIFYIILFAIFSNPFFAQSQINLTDYNCDTIPISYFADGEQSEGILLFVNHYDREISLLQYTNIYLLSKTGQNRQLVGDTNALTGAYGFFGSPDKKYVAVFKVAEGHPWIEIYDLQKLINTSELVLITYLQPYPGSIDIVGWQNGEKLIIDSDINLLLKNENKEISEYDMLEKSKRFSYDIVNNIYAEMK